MIEGEGSNSELEQESTPAVSEEEIEFIRSEVTKIIKGKRYGDVTQIRTIFAITHRLAYN